MEVLVGVLGEVLLGVVLTVVLVAVVLVLATVLGSSVVDLVVLGSDPPFPVPETSFPVCRSVLPVWDRK